MLKAIYDSKDQIPEGLVDHFTERDGKWELQVEGMKTSADVERVKRDLVKEREAHKSTKDKVRPVLEMLDGDVTIETIVERLDNYEALEAKAAGTDDKDIEARVNSMVEARVKPIQRQLDAAVSERDKFKTDAETALQTLTSRNIAEAIQKACRELNVDPKSVDDVLMYSGKFVVDDEGNVVTKDDAVTPKMWLEDMKDKRNWWGPSQGAGANGGTGEGGGGSNPWSKQNWNVTEQAKFIQQHGVDKAKAMASRAGLSSHIATRPADK